MRHRGNDEVLKEMIGQLAIQQMADGVLSIILTRVANGGVEVNIVQDLNEFGSRLVATLIEPAKNI